MDNNIGKKLDGRYELLELIGVGGMADIYRARDIQENEIVAVKILKTEFAGSDEFLRRFRNESKAIALLSHPNIVKIYDVGFTDKVQFIVMEYVDGITLTDYIEQQGVLKWRDAVHFTIQVLRALMHAHDRGIVHRDVKSSNIMLLSDGTIKVMDFGIARFNRENNKTMSEKAIGSVHYISPEQARGDITDERSDIYSVGVALYEMLTGRKPFDGDTPVAIALKHMQSVPKKPSEINETIPEGLEQIVLRAMQKDPAARYQTAGEMINDLEEFKKNPGIVFDYKYNSTDGTAKYIDRPNPAVDKEAFHRKKVVRPEENDYDEDDDDYDDDYDDDDEYEDRRSPLIPILFAVGAAFVIATVFLVLKLVVDGLGANSNSSDSQTPSNGIVVQSGQFPMPNLVGMTWDEAMALYGDEQYMILVPQEEWNEIVQGEIFEQQYPEGRPVKVGTTVNVKVSKGRKQVEIQDFRNHTLASAEQQLRKDGFEVSKTYMEDEEIPADYVISTSPEAHTMLPQGSTVVLVVSLGPSQKSVQIQNMVGMPLSEAKRICDEQHLNVRVEYVGSSEEKDKVIAQSLPKNTIANRNDEIVLTVSKGQLDTMISKVEAAVPVGVSGEFEFRYYVNGVLDDEKTEIRDVSLAGSRSLTYEVEGEQGEVKSLVIKVKSMKTGKDGTFLEVNIDFSEDPPKQEEVQKNRTIFLTLNRADSSSESSSSTSEDNSSDSSDDESSSSDDE